MTIARGLRSFDVLHELLDHELMDSEGVSCGMVDDLELVVSDGDGTLEIRALLAGPGAWAPRLPALPRIIARWLAGTRRIRVPIDEVASVSEVIRLKSRATQLGLGVTDRRVGRWLRAGA